eukprot:CAMPEP_0182843562 /NCGR_PEP_ID=MMETSP0006_2-20121128/26261_1 /TAXON_ID=97485 /ORGANISM="Prymnesium parvum, Strain Texoma1" /LENGTH=573 /DNA_ID=CAMNT_0024973377 /DNA_START=136 /DNA_END=1853 /DNA_ORIENTATION=-
MPDIRAVQGWLAVTVHDWSVCITHGRRTRTQREGGLQRHNNITNRFKKSRGDYKSPAAAASAGRFLTLAQVRRIAAARVTKAPQVRQDVRRPRVSALSLHGPHFPGRVLRDGGLVPHVVGAPGQAGAAHDGRLVHLHVVAAQVLLVAGEVSRHLPQPAVGVELAGVLAERGDRLACAHVRLAPQVEVEGEVEEEQRDAEDEVDVARALGAVEKAGEAVNAPALMPVRQPAHGHTRASDEDGQGHEDANVALEQVVHPRQSICDHIDHHHRGDEECEDRVEPRLDRIDREDVHQEARGAHEREGHHHLVHVEEEAALQHEGELHVGRDEACDVAVLLRADRPSQPVPLVDPPVEEDVEQGALLLVEDGEEAVRLAARQRAVVALVEQPPVRDGDEVDHPRLVVEGEAAQVHRAADRRLVVDDPLQPARRRVDQRELLVLDGDGAAGVLQVHLRAPQRGGERGGSPAGEAAVVPVEDEAAAQHAGLLLRLHLRDVEQRHSKGDGDGEGVVGGRRQRVVLLRGGRRRLRRVGARPVGDVFCVGGVGLAFKGGPCHVRVGGRALGAVDAREERITRL